MTWESSEWQFHFDVRSRGFTGGQRTSWKINVQTCSDSCDMCDLAGVKEQKVPTVRCRVRESSRAHHPLLPCMTCMSCCITFGYSYCLISGGRTRICVGSYRRPHRHASGVCSQLVCKSTHASQRIARVSRSCSRTRVQVLWFLWCMHGLSKFWLDSSKPFLILERVVPVAAMKFLLLLLVAAARSAEKRFRLKQRVFYLEEAIWINSEVHDRNILKND